MGVIQGILPIEGNPARLYNTKDAGAKWTGRKDELDLMERLRSMLAHAKLPKMFWAEALMPATYVIYRSPSTPLDEDTLQRVRTGNVMFTVLDVLIRGLSYCNI